MGNIKIPIKKLLELINTFSEAVGCKINYIYTSSEQPNNATKKGIYFIIETKRVKNS